MSISERKAVRQWSNKYVDVVYYRYSFYISVTCKSRRRINTVMDLLYCYGLSFDISYHSKAGNYGKVDFQIPVFVGPDYERRDVCRDILYKILDGTVDLDEI